MRWLLNQALAEQRARHARGEKYASYMNMSKWLTSWRNAPATAWLAEGPAQPQQHVLKRLDEAYTRFFAKAGDFPSFKKHGFDPSIRFPEPKQFVLDEAGPRLKLPKLGWVRLRLSRPVEGELRNATIVREGERWFVSLQARTVSCLPACLPACGRPASRQVSGSTSVWPLAQLPIVDVAPSCLRQPA